MSEEEKKAIEYFKNLDISFNTLMRIELKGFEKAVNTLLNLIDKQQKEIEELKKGIEGREARIQEEISENCKLKTELYGNSISKDKIREKIKEVSNGTYDAKIILEKLLEE